MAELTQRDKILINDGLKAERSLCYKDKERVQRINNLLRKIKVNEWSTNQKSQTKTNKQKHHDKEDKPQEFVVMNQILKKGVKGEPPKGSVVQIASVGKA